MAKHPLDPLLPAIADLVSFLDETGLPGALIGAAAVGIVSQARITRDIDVVVISEPDRCPNLVAQAAKFGFEARISDYLAFARRTRVLLLRHVPSQIDVDVSLGIVPFEKEMIARCLSVEFGGIKIPVARPEDLIVTKAVAGRPRDYVDIELLLDGHPNLDLARVRHWLPQFAEALEMPEIVSRFEDFLVQYRRTR